MQGARHLSVTVNAVDGAEYDGHKLDGHDLGEGVNPLKVEVGKGFARLGVFRLQGEPVVREPALVTLAKAENLLFDVTHYKISSTR